MCDPSCYVCGHSSEEHRDEYAECEAEGCERAYFEEDCHNCGECEGCEEVQQ
jgi:hypothetical protein